MLCFARLCFALLGFDWICWAFGILAINPTTTKQTNRQITLTAVATVLFIAPVLASKTGQIILFLRSPSLTSQVWAAMYSVNFCLLFSLLVYLLVCAFVPHHVRLRRLPVFRVHFFEFL